jgi:hypothetical protein
MSGRKIALLLLLLGGAMLVASPAIPSAWYQSAPVPIPTPQPSAVAAVYLIHESADGNPAMTTLKADLSWKAALDDNSVRWLIADDDAAEKSLPNVVAMARKQGLPAAVWVDVNGLGAAKACPSTAAEMLALLKEIGAAK